MGELTKSEQAKDKRLRTVYNTTLEAQNAQLEEQHHACAICRRPFPQFQAFQDHSHKCCARRLKAYCGKCNRGLLCYLCNKYAVGLIEWLEKMNIPIDKVVEYIRFWDAEIKRKGGYEPKPKATKKRKAKTNSRVSKEQKGI